MNNFDQANHNYMIHVLMLFYVYFISHICDNLDLPLSEEIKTTNDIMKSHRLFLTCNFPTLPRAESRIID